MLPLTFACSNASSRRDNWFSAKHTSVAAVRCNHIVDGLFLGIDDVQIAFEVERDEILLGLFELRTNRQEETALPSTQAAE